MEVVIEPATLYQAALKIFARYGFRRARVEDIAGELGVAVGTLYRYAANKRDLYEKTVAFGIGRWQQKVVAELEGIDDVRDKFKTMCLTAYDHLAGDPDLRAILVDDPSVFPLVPRNVRFPEIDSASMHLIRQILTEGIDRGVFRPVDVNTTADLLYSIYVMFIIKTYIKSEGRSTRSMFEGGLDLILNGLLAG